MNPFIDLLTPPEPCLRGRNDPSLNIYRLHLERTDETSITLLLPLYTVPEAFPLSPLLSLSLSRASIESAF